MPLTPIIADATDTFISVVVILWWIFIIGGSIPGIMSLSFHSRTQKGPRSKSRGVELGIISAVAGTVAILLLLLFAPDVGILAWVGALAPLAVGTYAIHLWRGGRRLL
jgi:hypothetical protein